MRTFLKVCLLLGVVAVRIPSALGLQCILCGFISGNLKKCEDYTEYNPGDPELNQTCPHEGNTKFVCWSRTDRKTGEVRKKCTYGVAPGCYENSDDYDHCYCDEDLCNMNDRCNCKGSAGGDPGSNKSGSGNNKSGSLKGASFGIMVMVLILGGGGLIQGQLWG